MPEHPNLELFQRMFTLFSEGDLDSLGMLFAQDVTWHTSGQNPLSGEYHGRDATLASFAKEFELSGGTYTSTVRDVLVNDQRIVALLRASASRESRTFDGDYVIVFDVVDGQVEEAREFWMDQAIVDAFWS
jgi:ketosteroid isomerase-like protein